MSKPKKQEPCPDCWGRGSVSVATEDVECSACGGTGKVKDAEEPAS